MDVVLTAGLWLDGSAWDAVVPHLRELGHQPVPVWLPGQGVPSYADFFEMADGVMPFPGCGPFDGPDSADLDEQQRRRIADAAHPVPEGVAKGIVRLRDDKRLEVPVTLICPEFSPAQAREWIDGGQVPELASARHIDYVDIDSGHWPMFTRPAELAGLLAEAARA